jgi:hypothetical protein
MDGSDSQPSVNPVTTRDRLHRLRRAYSRLSAANATTPREPLDGVVAAPPSSPVPSRVARMLALAHLVDRLVESGRFCDFAHAAQVFGVTRARMSQVMQLRYLPTPEQENILLGRTDLSERDLRSATRVQNPPT